MPHPFPSTLSKAPSALLYKMSSGFLLFSHGILKLLKIFNYILLQIVENFQLYTVALGWKFRAFLCLLTNFHWKFLLAPMSLLHPFAGNHKFLKSAPWHFQLISPATVAWMKYAAAVVICEIIIMELFLVYCVHSSLVVIECLNFKEVWLFFLQITCC